jgi:hypothetical protein
MKAVSAHSEKAVLAVAQQTNEMLSCSFKGSEKVCLHGKWLQVLLPEGLLGTEECLNT